METKPALPVVGPVPDTPPSFFIVSLGLVTDQVPRAGESDLQKIQSGPGNSLALVVSSRPFEFSWHV